MRDEDRDYEVGYGKPPKASRFQRGQSGNPRGRPKRDANVAQVLRRVSQEKVKVNGPNGSNWITKLDALIKQLYNKAVLGDLRAARLLLQIYEKHPDLWHEDDTPIKLIVNFVKPHKYEEPALRPNAKALPEGDDSKK